MMQRPFNAAERAELLRRGQEELRRYNICMDRIADSAPGSEQESAATAEAEQHMAIASQAEDEYFQRLPRMVVSCCPFDGKPLVRTFDPYGLDGPWWRSDATPTEVPSCPHFCVLRGGMCFGGGTPEWGDFTVNTGPQAPYVIPRLLEKPGMHLVLSQLKMAAGWTVHLMAYFAERRPPVQELTANWPRTHFFYTTAMGQHRWREDHASVDFEILPWLMKGKVRWCDPGSSNDRLSDGAPTQCPYLKHPAPATATPALGPSGE